MAITDKKGINVTSGFKLVSGQPLDARLIAVDETDLQSLVDNGAVYDGMIVWVQSLNKYMSYNGTEFKELATGGGSGGGTPAYVENETLFLGDVTTGGGGNSGGITDVDKLPDEWKGTPVPNSGYVEKMYVNTNLSKEKFCELLDTLGLEHNESYYILNTLLDYETDNGFNFYLNRGDSGDNISYYDLNSGGYDIIHNGIIYTNKFVKEVNGNVLSEEPDGFLVGTKNELISSLVSITPFEPLFNTKAIYRLPNNTLWVFENGWKEIGSYTKIKLLYGNNMIFKEEADIILDPSNLEKRQNRHIASLNTEEIQGKKVVLYLDDTNITNLTPSAGRVDICFSSTDELPTKPYMIYFEYRGSDTNIKTINVQFGTSTFSNVNHIYNEDSSESKTEVLSYSSIEDLYFDLTEYSTGFYCFLEVNPAYNYVNYGSL